MWLVDSPLNNALQLAAVKHITLAYSPDLLVVFWQSPGVVPTHLNHIIPHSIQIGVALAVVLSIYVQHFVTQDDAFTAIAPLYVAGVTFLDIFTSRRPAGRS
jgi:hypothetical protein